MKRRALLQSGLLGATSAIAAQSPPVRQFINTFLRSFNGTASAADSDVPNYIVFNFAGAPPRWCFDHFLKTKPTEPDLYPNSLVSTRYSGGGATYTQPEYSLFSHNGVLVPHMWSTSVAGVSGMVPLTGLLDNMLVIRGYGTGVDGHPNNSVMQTAPVPSVGSIHGAIADISQTPLRALQYPDLGTFSGYRSNIGTGITTLQPVDAATNLLSSALSSFRAKTETAAAMGLKTQFRDVAEQVQMSFENDLYNQVQDAQAIIKDHEAAQKTLINGVEDLIAMWPGLFQKYYNLITATSRALDVPFLTDKPIIVPSLVPNLAPGDVFGLHTIDGVYYPTPGTDIRTWLATTNYARIAQGFALAEFAVVNKYASTVELGIENFSTMVLTGSFSSSSTGLPAPVTKQISVLLDQHATGSHAGLMLNTAMYRGFASCLTELIRVLKAKSLFEKSFIHVVSDFGRTPRDTGHGADHGYDGMITSVFSGVIEKGPLVVGNVNRNGIGGAYTTSYGNKDVTTINSDLGTQNLVLGPAHVASSMAVLMGLPENRWINLAQPLVGLQNNRAYVKASGRLT